MSILPRVLLSVGSLMGAAMVAAVQIPPETATSNLAAWAQIVGFHRVAVALPPGVDRWVTAFGMAFVVTSALIAIDVARWASGKAPAPKRKSRRSG
jgi:hypothetical protein